MPVNQSQRQWILTAEDLPDEGQLVRALSPELIESTYQFISGRWIDPVSGVAMYWVPPFWTCDCEV